MNVSDTHGHVKIFYPKYRKAKLVKAVPIVIVYQFNFEVKVTLILLIVSERKLFNLFNMSTYSDNVLLLNKKCLGKTFYMIKRVVRRTTYIVSFCMMKRKFTVYLATMPQRASKKKRSSAKQNRKLKSRSGN